MTIKWATVWRLVIDIVESVLVGAVISAFLLVFVVAPSRVEGISMEPTLRNGDRVVIEKVTMRFGALARNTIVVIRYDDGYIIKRVVAVAGDVIQADSGILSVNGVLVGSVDPNASYTVVVASGSVFVLGDNDTHSLDSRAFGLVSLDDIEGRVILRYAPVNRIAADFDKVK